MHLNSSSRLKHEDYLKVANQRWVYIIQLSVGIAPKSIGFEIFLFLHCKFVLENYACQHHNFQADQSHQYSTGYFHGLQYFVMVRENLLQ